MGPQNFVALACAYFELRLELEHIEPIPSYHRWSLPDDLSVEPLIISRIDDDPLVSLADSAGHTYWLTVPSENRLRPLKVKMLTSGEVRESIPQNLLVDGHVFSYGRVFRDDTSQTWDCLQLGEYCEWLSQEIKRLLPLRPTPLKETRMSNRVFVFNAERGEIVREAEGLNGDEPHQVVKLNREILKSEYPLTEKQIRAYSTLTAGDNLGVGVIAGFHPGEDEAFSLVGVFEGVDPQDVWMQPSVRATFTFDARELRAELEKAL